MPRRPAGAIASILLIAVAIFSFACGGGGKKNATPTSTAAVAASPTAPSGATATQGAPEPTSTPFPSAHATVEVPAPTTTTPGNFPVLKDIRAATHPGYDRVVFEFQGGLPGYRVGYIGPATQCGSGMSANIAGTALLEVHMTPANAHDDSGALTFTGNVQSIIAQVPLLRGMAQTCDFEADVTWVLGLNEEVDFIVTTLTNPPRVVIDLAQSSGSALPSSRPPEAQP